MKKVPGPEMMQALLDQTEASNRDMARLVVGFWKCLQTEGMDLSAATLVSCAWLQSIIALGKQ